MKTKLVCKSAEELQSQWDEMGEEMGEAGGSDADQQESRIVKSVPLLTWTIPAIPVIQCEMDYSKTFHLRELTDD